MKRPIYIMNVFVYRETSVEGEISFDEFQDEGLPLRFFAVPRKDDVFFLDSIYYKVLFVQYEVARKRYPRPIFFAEGTLFVKEIGGKLEFRDVLQNALNQQ